jgi:hypothetical protein
MVYMAFKKRNVGCILTRVVKDGGFCSSSALPFLSVMLLIKYIFTVNAPL